MCRKTSETSVWQADVARASADLERQKHDSGLSSGRAAAEGAASMQRARGAEAAAGYAASEARPKKTSALFASSDRRARKPKAKVVTRPRTC